MRDITNEARLTMQDRNVDVQEGIRFRSVRRRLFQEDEEIEGDRRRVNIEDHVDNCFFEEARKHREEAKQKWNFDFEKEIPLPGNYQWIKLDRDGNEIPLNTEVQNKTEKMEKDENDELKELKEEGELKQNKVKEENKDKDDEEEEPPERKEVDGNDKTDSRRQKDRNHSQVVNVL